MFMVFEIYNVKLFAQEIICGGNTIYSICDNIQSVTEICADILSGYSFR